MAEIGLSLFRRERLSQVLGPGRRAVLWAQGCPLACPGCLVPESWSKGRGLDSVEEVAAWLLECPDVEGITLSGGEPMLQAEAFAALLDRVRSQRDLGAMCYTGYRYEELRKSAQARLLERLDLLVDGRYLLEQHSDLLWRGSSNQRLIPLSERYRSQLPPHRLDRSVGMEYSIRPDGGFAFAGVPIWPDYRAQLEV